jgi:catalase
LTAIGTNYLQLPVNAPKVEVDGYNKDGQVHYRHNNAQLARRGRRDHAERIHQTQDDDDFGQAGTMYRSVLDDAAKARLAHNITEHLKAGVEPRILRAAVDYWKQVDVNLAARVAQGVGV